MQHQAFLIWQILSAVLIVMFPFLPHVQKDGMWILAWIFLSWTVTVLSFFFAWVTKLIIHRRAKNDAKTIDEPHSISKDPIKEPAKESAKEPAKEPTKGRIFKKQ